MKIFSFFLFFFFMFLIFADDNSGNHSVYLSAGARDVATGLTLTRVPVRVVATGPEGAVIRFSTTGVGVYLPFDRELDEEYLNAVITLDSYGSESGDVSISISYLGADPENPDNPDPDNPNPNNPSAPWALESTLQNTNSMINSIGTGLSNWSSWMNNYFDSLLKSNINSIPGLLGTINSQQVNMSDTMGDILDQQLNTNSKLDSANTALGNIDRGIGNSNTSLGNINTGIGSANTALGNINSGISGIDRQLSGVQNKQERALQNQSEINGKLGNIKDIIQPPGTSVPERPSQLDEVPATGQGVMTSVSSELNTGFRGFTPSGDPHPTFNFVIPLRAFGMEDFTITLGGSDWTNQNFRLQSLASFVRTISKFAFYLLFFKAVIHSLRQW